MRVLPFLLGLSALVSARCGTRNPSEAVKARHKVFQEKEFREASRSSARDNFEVTIDTYVHVVQANTTRGLNKTLVPTQIHRQIDVMNEHYAGTGFSFNLVNISYSYNNNWGAISDGSQAEWEVKSSLRRGDYRDLNLYIGNIGAGILGYATFPDNVGPRDFKLDGVVVDPGSLPGGKPPFNLGITAVHEVGHWLNLLHTFQPTGKNSDRPGCFGPGDFIFDTPAEAYPNFGCPARRDTCTGVDETSNPASQPGPDPIHNFMDYSDDRCLTHFSAGQVRRMQSSWIEERAGYVPVVAGRRVRPGLDW